MVHSQRLDREYSVIQTETGWVCDCPDAQFRLLKCKHQWAVEISWTLRKRVEEARRIEPIQGQACVACGSESLMRWGVRHNKSGDIQKFMCRGCGRFFTVNIGFEKMKHNPKAITTALQLYFSGESLRKTKDSLRLMGVEVSAQTVLNWIGKYVGLMEKYADSLAPKVSDTWRADELYVKVKGNLKYLYAMMDDETRYWIAQEVADTKYIHDARNLLRMSKEVAGKRPHTLITDGAQNYAEAVTREFWPNLEPRTRHIRDIRFDGTIHNNKMERMNGEIRDREEVMRGIKTMDTPILKGMQIYHNFIKPHEGLDGRTPAEATGLVVTGSDRWLTLIQNASRPNEFRQSNREGSPNAD
ncbi:MAG: IS1/IS6 family transposase [Thaumarchaeota archaeon]|nr:IS1/IS6 family transposase [Nitrososphaerota archaeon]